LTIYEAGHPIPDENSFRATEHVLEMTADLSSDDTVLFLLSGGGSALFESPIVPDNDIEDITTKLLSSGADIIEMNTIRKRLSRVKGGKFALHCFPAEVFTIILSDIIGSPLDMIASGPTVIDRSTAYEAEHIINKYKLKVTTAVKKALQIETPKLINNVETVVIGSVAELCYASEEAVKEIGYHPIILTDSLNCEAREAGKFLSAIARYHQKTEKSLAFIVGGETVVRLTGHGKGGRNQEIVLAAAEEIRGLQNTAIFSVGSDGTDGPTDAAGGYVDGCTAGILDQFGISIYDTLADNNAYYALQKAEGLIITGATGTNVNDVSVVLIKR
jgi:hydroxypyruvate reductase